VLAAQLVGAGCVDYLDPGELGTPRYFGDVRGAAPVRMLPPISDRDGNAYVLYGSRDQFEVLTFVGHPGGGWSSDCGLHKSDARGLHGWIGRSQDRAWYWSGDALVELLGEDGTCEAVLDREPTTGAEVRFLGVVPWVKETPSRRTVVALADTPSSAVPYTLLIDLDTHQSITEERFDPPTARELVVLGTGASPARGEGVMVVKYLDGDVVRVEARFVDAAGRTTARAPLTGADDLPVDAVLGELAVHGSGLVVGLLITGDLLVFDHGSGGVRGAPGGLATAGVHAHEGELWLVGVAGGQPALSRVDASGSFGSLEPWTASARAASALEGDLTVLDDRTDPRYYTSWRDPRSAIGAFPLLSPFTPHAYASGTTLWLVAGPSFDAGGEPRTAVALVPVGLSYP
jgi:hypothetical protein